MDSREFEILARDTIASHFNETIDLHPSAKGPITAKDVYVVWSAKVLQNNKAILSTDAASGLMYELTYNGDKDELYLDEYSKTINRKINMYHPS